VIDFDILWNKKVNGFPFSKRSEFKSPGKAIGKHSMNVIRPAMIRAPLLSYFSFVPSFIVEFIKQIKVFKPDIVIGQGVLNVFLASIIIKIFRIPFIRYILDSAHTLIPERYLQPLGFALETAGLKNTDDVIVINKQLGEYSQRMGSPHEPRVITAGVDDSRFNHLIDGAEIRQQLGVSEDETLLFFMGWLYDFSGLRELTKAMSLLTDSKFRLLILGRGDLYEELKDIASNTQIENIILIHDWVHYDRVPKFVAAADICLLPAHLNRTMRDIVPIKLYEYLACGKPVIATRLPGVYREFGSNSGIIYITKPEQILEVASHIRRNSTSYYAYKQKALEFVKDFGWESIADNFENILKKIVKTHNEE